MDEEAMGRPENACFSCQRKLYKAGGALRCLVFKSKSVTACSDYCGPFPELHIPLPWGKEYSESLSREKGSKRSSRSS
jgi:hypothetical protein